MKVRAHVFKNEFMRLFLEMKKKKKKEMSLYTMIIIHDHVFFNDAKSIMVNLFCFLLFELFKMATMFFNYQDQLIILRMGATVSM